MENLDRTEMTLEGRVDRLESMADRIEKGLDSLSSAVEVLFEQSARRLPPEARSRVQKAILFNLNESAKTASEARDHALDALAIVAMIETHHDKDLWANPDDDLRELREHLNEIQWRCGAVAQEAERAANGQP